MKPLVRGQFIHSVTEAASTKDSSGREVPGAGPLVAFMVGIAAFGVGAIVYGLRKQPSGVASPRWRPPVPVRVFLVLVWAALLIVAVARERWLGVAGDGLLPASSAFTLWRSVRRRPSP